MRADIDQTVGNSVESCKDEPKPHKCPEEKWEEAELKISENGKNNNTVCELFYDTRSSDEWDKENDGNHSFGDSNETERKLQDNSHDTGAKRASLEKVDPVFYMDKNVTACDLPEIVVCYNEKTYHIVKDICVDEGVLVQEKSLFGEKDSVRCNTISNQCESEDLMKADKVNVSPFDTKSSEDRNSKLDDSELCNDFEANRDVEVSSREGFVDAEGSSYCNQLNLIVTREAKGSPAHESNLSEISHEIEADENRKDEVATSDNVLKDSLTLGDILSREDEQIPLNNNSNNSHRREEQSPPQCQQEKGKTSQETTAIQTELEETEEPTKAEEKLSSVSTTTSQEPNRTLNDPERPETDNQQPNFLMENSFQDDKLFSSGFGETSFSAAETVSISGHITYSGPIAFSGSLSVRSDASTTSGRSFAFPILQSEWNSSPVRMAKADKRRQKGWRDILLCCRFS